MAETRARIVKQWRVSEIAAPTLNPAQQVRPDQFQEKTIEKKWTVLTYEQDKISIVIAL